MIRVRRVQSPWPFVRLYEISFTYRVKKEREGTYRLRRAAAVNELERRWGGIGDAWASIDAADRAWDRRQRGWAVEFDDEYLRKDEPE